LRVCNASCIVTPSIRGKEVRQLSTNVANRLYVISAPALMAVLAEAAFGDHSPRAASTGTAPADA